MNCSLRSLDTSADLFISCMKHSGSSKKDWMAQGHSSSPSFVRMPLLGLGFHVSSFSVQWSLEWLFRQYVPRLGSPNWIPFFSCNLSCSDWKFLVEVTEDGDESALSKSPPSAPLEWEWLVMFAVFDPIATGPLVWDTLISYFCLMWTCCIRRCLLVLFKDSSVSDETEDSEESVELNVSLEPWQKNNTRVNYRLSDQDVF